MKKLKMLLPILLIGLLFAACQPRADYFKNGEAYYTKNVCVRSHTESYTVISPVPNGNGGMSMQPRTHTKTVCDEYELRHYKIEDYECDDIIEINRKKESRNKKTLVLNPKD